MTTNSTSLFRLSIPETGLPRTAIDRVHSVCLFHFRTIMADKKGLATSNKNEGTNKMVEKFLKEADDDEDSGK